MQYAPYDISWPNAAKNFLYTVRRGVLIYALFRIFSIQCPLGGIVRDIFPNTSQLMIITNDMFVVVALPEHYPRRTLKLVYQPRGRSLESAYDGTETLCR